VNKDVAQQRGWMWTARRVARGGPVEAVWRAVSFAQVAHWTTRSETGRVGLVTQTADLASIAVETDQVRHDVDRLIRQAEEILTGSYTVLGVVRSDLVAPDWLADGGAAETMGADLGGAPGQVSLKHVWELSRLAPVVDLALAWHVTRDDRFSTRAVELVESWLEVLDDRSSVLWGSGVEAALRVISLSWVTRLLESDQVSWQRLNQNDRLGICVHRFLDQLDRFPSRFSSANNHALVEAAGLVVGSLSFRCSQQLEWEQTGIKRLFRQLDLQIDQAGLTHEKAAEYQAFVSEVVTITVAAFDLAGRPRPQKLVDKLAQLVGGVQALTKVGSPRFGDGDDSTVFGSDRRTLLEHAHDLGAAVLGAAVLGDELPGDELLGHNPRSTTSVQSRLLRTLQPSGERTVSITEPSDKVLAECSWLIPLRVGDCVATMRSGSLGYLAVAAHAHADLSSVVLSVAGCPVLIDPGTFTYDSHPEWRRYFRSSSAHNCLSVNGMDHAQYWGPFLWGTAPTARLTAYRPSESVATGGVIHDGYSSMGIEVARSAMLTDSSLKLVDRIEGSRRSGGRSSSSETVAGSLVLTFDPSVTLVESSTSDVALQFDQYDLAVHASDGWELQTVFGDATGAGWCSPRFGERQATVSVIARGPLVTSDDVTTTLTWSQRIT
jgi:hypothetical protein